MRLGQSCCGRAGVAGSKHQVIKKGRGVLSVVACHHLSQRADCVRGCGMNVGSSTAQVRATKPHGEPKQPHNPRGDLQNAGAVAREASRANAGGRKTGAKASPSKLKWLARPKLTAVKLPSPNTDTLSLKATPRAVSVSTLATSAACCGVKAPGPPASIALWAAPRTPRTVASRCLWFSSTPGPAG